MYAALPDTSEQERKAAPVFWCIAVWLENDDVPVKFGAQHARVTPLAQWLGLQTLNHVGRVQIPVGRRRLFLFFFEKKLRALSLVYPNS